MASRLVFSMRGDDGLLVLVQLAHEGADLGQHRAELGLAAVEGVVQLGEDGLELADAAAVEQQRERAEDLFDLGVAAGAVQADDVVVRKLAAAGLRRRRELDELLPEQAGLADLGAGVVRAGRRPRDLDA